MNKRKITWLTILLLTVLLSVAGTGQVSATSYSKSREQASQGSSEVFDSFLTATVNDESEEAASTPPTEQDYNELMIKYQGAIAHDPVADILTLFPVASRERIAEFRTMDDTEVAQLLADNPPEQRILALVIARSPRIARAEDAWQASINLYPQTQFLQDILTRYQSLTSGLSIGIGEEYQIPMIQMNYPNSGMLSLRGRAVEIDIEKAYSDILREASESVADTKILLAQIRSMEDLIENSRSSLSLLNILSDVARVQYVAGTRTFSDLIRLQTEQAKRGNEIQRLESEKAGLFGQLAASMSLPGISTVGDIQWTEDTRPEIDEVTLRDNLAQTRQEIVQAALDVEKMDVMIEMTRREAAPDLTFGMSYYQGTEPFGSASGDSSMSGMGGTGTQDSGTDSGMSGMGSEMGGASQVPVDQPAEDNQVNMGSPSFMNTPMVDYRNSNYPVDFTWAAEMVDRRAEMASMLENMTAMAGGMFEMQISRYNQGLKSENTYTGRVIPDARATLDVVRIGYSGNENSFSDLINSELTLLDARNELARISMDRRVALAEIERLVGRAISPVQ